MQRRSKLNLDDYFPYLVNRVATALTASFGAALVRHDLSISMWRVIAALSVAESQRLTDLGAMTSIDVSTLSRMVTRLVQRGLVSRTRSTQSEREVTVRLDSKGRKLLDALIPDALATEKSAIAHISRDDLATVKRVLRQMHSNLTPEDDRA